LPSNLKGRKGNFHKSDEQRGLRADLKSFAVYTQGQISQMSCQSLLLRELRFTQEGRDAEGVCNNHFRRAGAEKIVENSQEWNIRVSSYCLKENVDFPMDSLDRAASSSKVYLGQELV